MYPIGIFVYFGQLKITEVAQITWLLFPLNKLSINFDKIQVRVDFGRLFVVVVVNSEVVGLALGLFSCKKCMYTLHAL
jgi:hypothetical protein